MQYVPLAVSQTDAIFIITILVVIGAIGLTVFAVMSKGDQKFIGGVVGLLLGVVGAGGIGALFVDKSAKDAAKDVKQEVKKDVKQEVKSEVKQEVKSEVKRAK